MEKDYSEQAISKFMDYSADKGLINKTTAQSRKTACVRIFAMLEPDEKKDLRKIDFDDVFARFQTKHAHDMGPDSFVTYKSRGKKALEDFLIWVENPSGFRPKTPKKMGLQKATIKDKEAEPVSKKNNEMNENMDSFNPPQRLGSSQHLSVLIRENVLVQVSNLPFDLKKQEADRIKNIIDAHVLE